VSILAGIGFLLYFYQYRNNGRASRGILHADLKFQRLNFKFKICSRLAILSGLSSDRVPVHSCTVAPLALLLYWDHVAKEPQLIGHPVRRVVLQGLGLVEDLVYAGLGILLAVTAVTLLVAAFQSLVGMLFKGLLAGQVVSVLDQILLILLIIELLYTVQVSFREHGLLAEPFLVVALIAVIRRVLVLTAELPKLPEAGGTVFSHALLELALLTIMIFVLVASFIMLQKQAKQKPQAANEEARV
jgi:uncharacterized membrane protein (DUF373 family)